MLALRDYQGTIMAMQVEVVPYESQCGAVPVMIWMFLMENEEVLRRRCRQLMRTPQDAEDALSELRLHLFKLLIKDFEQLALIKNVTAWLARIAHNYCIDCMRKTQLTCSLEWLDSDRSEPLIPQIITPGPEQNACFLETLTALTSAMGRLPVLLCEAIELRCVEGAEYDEIAAALETTESNVRKRVQLGRRQLRILMNPIKD